MFIENPDAFKSWLTSILEPLCDADPEALAKYVFALVKKDKPLEELRECMIEQLDVFLQSETKPFVELLFKTLDNQEYLNNSHVIPNTNPPNPNVPGVQITLKRESSSPKADTLVVKDMKPIIPVSTLPNLSESINGAVKTTIKADDGAAVVPTTVLPNSMKRKSDMEKDETAVAAAVAASSRSRSTRTRHRSSSRNRSRSRSWDRSAKQRSRSRERSPRIERRDRSRPWRNKSPPRRYDRERRRSRSGSPIPIGSRMRSRSRSPRHSYRIGGRYRNRSPPRSISRSRSRSNERTSRVDKEKKIDKDDNSGGATPTQDSNHGDTDMRLTNTTQSIQSVVSALNPPGESFLSSGKRRCRDFDEKGYCMRGEMCPYDHGVDPVVLEDTALSRVLTFGPNGAPQVVTDGTVVVPGTTATASTAVIATAGGGGGGSVGGGIGGGGGGGVVCGGSVGGSGGGPPGIIMNPIGMLGMSNFHQRNSLIHSAEYNPSAPGMWHHRPGFRPRGPPGGGPPSIRGVQMAPNNVGPFGAGPMQSIQRELINVPVMDNMQMQCLNIGSGGGGSGGGGYKRRSDYNNHSPDMMGQQPPMKKRQGGFDFNRLGPRTGDRSGGSMLKNPANCSLELKKVPRGLNNITHLNNHFGKFGKIVNIQVCFEGDPEGAIVTFSSHAEANAAYRSTEAVLNNRFIKVFWHSGVVAGGENIPPMQTNNGQRASVSSVTIKERLGQPVTMNTNKVLNLVQPKAIETRPGVDETDDTSENNKLSSATNVYVPSFVKKQQDVVTLTVLQQQQKEDSKALANAAIVKNQEILAAKEQLKKKHEEKRKEAFKITQDLRKRKQELLEKQLAQQKLLIEKLEKTNPSGQQRELLMSTIKTVQESIESIRKDMVNQTVVANISTKVTATVPPLPRKSKEEAQREVLDAELDLITRQQEGGDTSELQRRLLELRAQAYNLTRGVPPQGPGGVSRRGRSALRARHHLLHHHHHLVNFNFTKNNMMLDNTKRAGGNLTSSATTVATAIAVGTNKKPHNVIDHRPTRLLISGYEGDESECVIAHFAQYGDITEYLADDSTPSLILTYRTRKEAEIAIIKGKHFQDRTLSVTWCTDAQLNTLQRAANTRTVVLTNTSGVVATTSNDQDQQHKNESVEDDVKKLSPGSDVQDQQENITETSTSQHTNKEIIEQESGFTNTEDQLLEGDDENISGEQLGTELSEEALLQDDEEDLDEDEERSWRR